jgi:peptidoglycan/LPS O-acetylase OafA/YrhL
MMPWLRGEAYGTPLSAAVQFWETYTFVRIAVPAFFVMSGFFLSASAKGYWENHKKRFWTLYIPFVLWNAFNVGVLLLSSHLVRLGGMQFWYMQSIFIFLLLSPVVFALLKRRWTVGKSLHHFFPYVLAILIGVR